jgi:hypothetical protein
MSRKTIITDFRALKGKITLSDAKDIPTWRWVKEWVSSLKRDSL